MKTIAIALRTTINPKLPDEMKTRLEDLNMDKRLKKAESIKAYLGSAEHVIKKELYATRHAEFGEISSIATADEAGLDEIADGEEAALTLLESRISEGDRIVLFDEDHCLAFIMKRAMLSEHRLTLREKLYPNLGTSTTMVLDLKRAWAGTSKEYGSMTLKDLITYLDYPITARSYPFNEDVGSEAVAILEVYDFMKGHLCS